MFRAGAALVLLGTLLLGWFGWQVWGTTWQSDQRHEALVASVEHRWRHGATVLASEHGEVTSVVRIPAFGEQYAVPLIEGVSDDALASGLGHVTGTAGPGEVGNFALAGHRITHGEPLHDLPTLRPGDRVLVDTADWTYTYLLDTGGDDLEVPFTASWVLDPHPVDPHPVAPHRSGVDRSGVGPSPTSDSLITLTTCAELFHTDQRLVVFGHLVGRTPRTDAG